MIYWRDEYIIIEKNNLSNPQDFASFNDAAYVIKVVEAIIESSIEKKWKKVE
jgi:N-acetylmuramoyl-L-alanine amidase